MFFTQKPLRKAADLHAQFFLNVSRRTSAETIDKEAPPFVLKTGNMSASVDSLRVDGKKVFCQFVIDTGSSITLVRYS